MNTNYNTRDEIISSAARAFYTEAWISNHEDQSPHDVPAKTSRAAFRFSRKFIKTIEILNMETIEQSYERALEANKVGKTYRKRDSADDFGYYLAMQSMGHGVAWTDDNASFEFKRCSAHFYGQTGEIGFKSVVD